MPAEAMQYYTTAGRNYEYGPQKNTNRLLTAYLNYNKYLEGLKSNIDATVGYDYQYWKSTSPAYAELNTLGETQTSIAASDQRHTLLSYYARLNYTYDSRYMLTATIRRDGTSRFDASTRWGTFPSVALGWRVTEESFLKDNAVLSNLKIRASFGITGQQDGIGNYGHLPVYTIGQDGAQYQFGNEYYYTYRPQSYNKLLKWETTTAYNIGFDFGSLNNRLSGSVDYFRKSTKGYLTSPSAVAYTDPLGIALPQVKSNGEFIRQGAEFILQCSPSLGVDQCPL